MSGLSQIFGGIVGAIAGWIISGGNPYGAFVGFGIGMGIGSFIDPVTPDIVSPGQMQITKLNISTADEGSVIPDGLGTFKCTGNIVNYWGDRSAEAGDERGTMFFLSWQLAICLGPVDCLYAVYAGDDLVWEGEVCRADYPLGYVDIFLEPHDITYSEREMFLSYKVYNNDHWEIISEGPVGETTDWEIVYNVSSVYWESDDPYNPYWRDGEEDYSYAHSAIVVERYDNRGGTYNGVDSRNVESYSYDPVTGYLTLTFVFDVRAGSASPWEEGSPPGYINTAHLIVYFNQRYAIAGTDQPIGSILFYFGTDAQVAHPLVRTSLDDGDLNPAYRGLCYAFFNDNYIGSSNRAPTMRFVMGKRPTYPFSSNETINYYDYNPVHAVNYVLTHDLWLGLDSGYIDDATFASVASKVYSEGRGISAYFDQQQAASIIVESLLKHMAGFMRSTSDE